MKIAVLGSGSAGLQHLKALRSLDGVEPIAVPIRSTRLTELVADGFLTVPDLHAAVSPGACAAVIATNTARHAKDTILALEAGLDVLVEKPIAVNAVEAHGSCQRAHQLGRKLFVGCVLRFSESLNSFRDLLGKVGRLHSVRIECQSYLPDWRPHQPYHDSYSARASEGGVLRDLIHEIDYAGWLFGWPAAVQARIGNLGRLGIAAEEIAELTWQTPAGCLVSVGLDYLSKPPWRRMRACGEGGTIEWNGIEGIVTLMGEGTPPRELRASQTHDELFLAQACAFVNIIRGASNPRLATAEDGVKALAVCDAARRAADRRREEAVEYPFDKAQDRQ